MGEHHRHLPPRRDAADRRRPARPASHAPAPHRSGCGLCTGVPPRRRRGKGRRSGRRCRPAAPIRAETVGCPDGRGDAAHRAAADPACSRAAGSRAGLPNSAGSTVPRAPSAASPARADGNGRVTAIPSAASAAGSAPTIGQPAGLDEGRHLGGDCKDAQASRRRSRSIIACDQAHPAVGAAEAGGVGC